MDEDEGIVRQLLEHEGIHTIPLSMVTLQPKIKIGEQIIFSQCQRRVKKRNSFTVAFIDPQDPAQFSYGRVERFLTCPADSLECVHIAIITKLRVESCQLLNMDYPPEIRTLAPDLCADFVSVVGESVKVAIPVEHILFKCFDISTIGFSGITTLVNQSKLCK